ncbi:MAG: hypothetical protein ACR2HR_09850 [Euzebya sp.]
MEVVGQDLLRAAGQATCIAVAGIMPPHVRLRLAWVEQWPATKGRQSLVNATVRAVLDALPRRLGHYMQI